MYCVKEGQALYEKLVKQECENEKLRNRFDGRGELTILNYTSHIMILLLNSSFLCSFS